MTLSSDVTVTDTGTGMVLLNERTGRYWTLNGTGRTVVRALMSGRPVQDAVDELTTLHPAYAERVAEDVEALLTSLVEAKVVLS
ncbi:lasso peptide biosynthesis PqqD family chaperone [Thermomonospora umbrina]|uniref:Coenzyme PQQ synthesis protein D (PqqD) n=1 Tax=Thermomonospora umbrina TaxID=111806 RepID=A0A3D9SWH0_9ACTN|nr:lasso peptide biosynthesis PqqD family chaperone [Thermomonospora umbrina]REE96914.1 coenzyme PQQ synthesis protein D (PqqD) [Thermomonospora umbrina]